MAKRKGLATGVTVYIASQMLPRFRDLYDLTFIDVKDTDPTGAKVPGAILGDLTTKARVEIWVKLRTVPSDRRQASLHYRGNLLECDMKA